MPDTPAWYVLTGGPSAGKTTLINALSERGYRTVSEAARDFIEEEIAKGKTYAEVRKDEAAFQRALVERKIAMEKALSREKLTFFDRGIPDSTAYYELIGLPIDSELRAALAAASYRKAFLLGLIPFEKDDIRKETQEDAITLNRLLRKSYEELGVRVVDVSVMPIQDRADFILANL